MGESVWERCVGESDCQSESVGGVIDASDTTDVAVSPTTEDDALPLSVDLGVSHCDLTRNMTEGRDSHIVRSHEPPEVDVVTIHVMNPYPLVLILCECIVSSVSGCAIVYRYPIPGYEATTSA